MIVIRLEMWPKGDHTRARSLGIATIDNVGGAGQVGDYDVRLFKAPEYSKNAEKRPLHEMLTRPLVKEIWRKGVVKAFPRMRLGPWDLLFRALAAAVKDRSPSVTLDSDEFLAGSMHDVGPMSDERRRPLRTCTLCGETELPDGSNYSCRMDSESQVHSWVGT